MTVDDIRAELRQVQATIDAAYWTFTRCARGMPPVLAVPRAYERRAELKRLLREILPAQAGQQARRKPMSDTMTTDAPAWGPGADTETADAPELPGVEPAAATTSTSTTTEAALADKPERRRPGRPRKSDASPDAAAAPEPSAAIASATAVEAPAELQPGEQVRELQATPVPTLQVAALAAALRPVRAYDPRETALGLLTLPDDTRRVLVDILALPPGARALVRAALET